MTTLLKTVSADANREVQKSNSTESPAYIRWLRSAKIRQAIFEMSDTPRFIPGNHRRHV